MKIDLTCNCMLDAELSDLYNEIAFKLRRPFTELVSEISKSFNGNLHWWVEVPASRNTLHSSFFHYYCALNFIEELILRHYEISEIVIDSIAFSKILEQYLSKKRLSISIKHNKNPIKFYLKLLLKPFLKIPLELFNSIYNYISAYRTKYLQKPLPNKPLTLIDTFILSGYVSKDRYYNGLWENLKPEQRETVYFVPTLCLIKGKNILNAYKELRIAEKNFLIKEDYLKIKDILYAVGHYIKIFSMKINPITILGADISKLVREELISMRGSGAVEGLLNYRFVQRLKEKKIQLHLVIDWWENQFLDKGWNAGFNDFYPETASLGYLGYAPRLNDLHIYSSSSEFINRVLPKKIVTIGKGFNEEVKEFCPNLIIDSAPAFRFQHLWNVNKFEMNPNLFTILVALTVEHKESFNILKLFNECIKKIKPNNWCIWIKPHPTMNEDTLKKGLEEEWPQNFIIIGGDSSKYISRADLMISGMSSICLETMALGIPVIIVEKLYGLKFCPIPKQIPQGLWSLCKNADDIEKAVKYYRDRTEKEIMKHRNIGLKIKEDFFEPVNKNSIASFLNIN